VIKTIFSLTLNEEDRKVLDKAAQREKRSLANFMIFYSLKQAKKILDGEKS
jgi:uncharacterized protein (DUF1778 family)